MSYNLIYTRVDYTLSFIFAIIYLRYHLSTLLVNLTYQSNRTELIYATL